MRRATIGGLSVELHGCDRLAHLDKWARFAYTGAPIDLRVTVRDVESTEPPVGTLLGRGAQARWVSLGDDRFALYRADHRVRVLYNGDLSDVTVELASPEERRDVYRYMYVQQAVSYRMAALGGLLLHSAGLNVRGRGVALSGRSGVGKSTLAAHCMATDPAIGIVCEDAPAVIGSDGGYQLCGTPFCGDDEACEATSVPLAAIVLLKQGEGNRLTKPSPRDALYELLQAVMRPYYHEEISARATQIALSILDEVPLYQYENDGTPSAGEALLRQLTAEGVL